MHKITLCENTICEEIDCKFHCEKKAVLILNAQKYAEYLKLNFKDRVAYILRHGVEQMTMEESISFFDMNKRDNYKFDRGFDLSRILKDRGE